MGRYYLRIRLVFLEIGFFLALLTGFTQVADAQVKVTSPPGIDVLTSTHPDFGRVAREFAAEGIGPSVEQMLPYSVVLTNRSPNAVIQHTIVWTFKAAGAQEKLVTTQFGQAYLIQPGQRRLVSHVFSLQLPPVQVPSQALSSLSAATAAFLEKYGRFSLSEVTIDSVLFTDGAFVGADTQKQRTVNDAVDAVFDAAAAGDFDVIKRLVESPPQQPWASIPVSFAKQILGVRESRGDEAARNEGRRWRQSHPRSSR